MNDVSRKLTTKPGKLSPVEQQKAMESYLQSVSQVPEMLSDIVSMLNDVLCDLRILSMYARRRGEAENVFGPEDITEIEAMDNETDGENERSD